MIFTAKNSYQFSLLYICFTTCLYATDPDTVTGILNDTAAPFDNPQLIVFTPNGAKAYVINYNDLKVDVVDVATGTVTGSVDDSFSSFDYPQGIAITPDGATLYVSNNYMDEVDIIDTTTDTMTSKVYDPENLIDYPIALAISPDGSTLYSLNQDGHKNIIIIDTATNTVIGSIDGSIFVDPLQIAITPDGQKAYIPDSSYGANGAIFILNLISNTITGTVTDTDGAIIVPYQIAISPDGKTAYVANNEGNAPANTGSVVVIDVATDTVVNNIIDNNFLYPQGITILPSGLLVYLSSGGDNGTTNYGQIFIIDPITQTVIGTVNDPDVTINKPTDFGVSPDGQTMYISNQDGNSVSVAFTIIPILPPTNLNVESLQNNFLTQIDLVNKLTWTAPSTGTAPSLYNIYKNEALTELIGSTPANILEFFEHNCQLNTNYNYYITSVDANGNSSAASHILVTTPKKLANNK
ncbi:MAG: beta-propeller fold lactonase family protein [Candidatus Chromulinivorax sp.]